jgi:hypothetical protein
MRGGTCRGLRRQAAPAVADLLARQGKNSQRTVIDRLPASEENFQRQPRELSRKHSGESVTCKPEGADPLKAGRVAYGDGVGVGLGVDDCLPAFSLVSSVTRKVFAWSNRLYR